MDSRFIVPPAANEFVTCRLINKKWTCFAQEAKKKAQATVREVEADDDANDIVGDNPFSQFGRQVDRSCLSLFL